MDGHEGEEQAGDQQDVQGVQPGDHVVPGELGAEREHAEVGAHHRDRQHDALRDPQARARQQVVRQGIAGETLGERQQEQRHADQPVDLTGAAERAREEDPQQVHADRREEHQRGPVVELADQQAAADVEADVQRRAVRLRHTHAVQPPVGAVVDDLRHGRVEEQRQPHARQQQDDEAVEGDLAQQERPVVGKGLPQQPAALTDREPSVGPVGGASAPVTGAGPSPSPQHRARVPSHPCRKPSRAITLRLAPLVGGAVRGRAGGLRRGRGGHRGAGVALDLFGA